MRRIDIPEHEMRMLVERYPFYEIARMYKCDARSIAALAAKYSLVSHFMASLERAGERERILELRATGMSVKRIAETIGRSQEFVARRIRSESVHGRGHNGAVETRAMRLAGWPIPDTNAHRALSGRRYDDIGTQTLVREVGQYSRPLNGAALASAVRAANLRTTTAAAMCVE